MNEKIDPKVEWSVKSIVANDKRKNVLANNNLSWDEKRWLREMQAASADTNFWVISSYMKNERIREEILANPELKAAWVSACEEVKANQPPWYKAIWYSVINFFGDLLYGNSDKQARKLAEKEREEALADVNNRAREWDETIQRTQNSLQLEAPKQTEEK